jgi:preprotein translocase subunit SecA
MKMTSRMIENAQKKVEAHNFEIRKRQLQYDDVMNHQRSLIYEQRMRVLRGQDMHESVLTHVREYVADRVKEFASQEVHHDDWNLAALRQTLLEIAPLEISEEQLRAFAHQEDLTAWLQDELIARYDEKERQLGVEQLRELERYVTLRVVNMRWVDHLAAMEDLEEGIGLRGYSGVDPLIIYQKESYQYWLNLLATIREDILRYLFHLTVETETAPARQYAAVTPRGVPVEAEDVDLMVDPAGSPPAARAPAPARPAPRRAPNPGLKVGRNDPCPCGSGQKYKKCCGRGK